MSSLKLMDVQHKDVVRKLFLYTFVDKASTWCFSLIVGSITSWQQFEIAFLTQFSDDKNYGVLLLELSRINFNKKENVKDFNQRFTNIFNRIPNKPAESVQIEFYTTTLPPSVVMFVKGKKKRNLEENFLEAIKVEKYLASILSHQGNEESKPSLSEKSIKKNKGISKTDSKKKDKETMDIESMKRVTKKLTNDIIDLNKNKGEVKKTFKLFLKKKTDSTSQIPLTSRINLEDHAMENYFHTHHVNHSNSTCLEFINFSTAMLTPPDPPKKENKNEKEEDDTKINRRRKNMRKEKNLHPT